MKFKTRILISILAFTLLVGPAFGQSDPKDSSPRVVFAAQTATATSSPYAIITSAAGHTVRVQMSSGGGVATLSLEGSLDTEVAVTADTADWTEIFSTTDMDSFIYIEDPPAYLRFVLTYTSGTIKVQTRGARLRTITVTP